MPPARRTVTLSHYLRVRLILAGLLVVLVAALFMLHAQFDLRVETLARRLAVSAELSAVQLATFLELHRDVVELLASEPQPVGHWDPALEQARGRFAFFVSMMAVGSDGIVLAGTPDRSPDFPEFRWPGRDVNDRAYFTEAVASRQSVITNAFQGRGFGDRPLVAVSAPILDDDGEVAGVVQGSIDVADFSRLQAQALRKRGQSLLVLDRSGQVVYASDGLRLPPLRQVHLDAQAGDGPLGLHELPSLFVDGDDALYGAGQTGFGWQVLVLQPRQALNDELQRDALHLLVPGILALLAIMLAAHLLATRLARPLKALTEHLTQFAADPTPRELDDPDAPREIQAVASAYNALSAHLSRTFVQLRGALAEQAQLRGALESTVAQREAEIGRRTEELQRANQELARHAITDELTGCLNYRGFQERLADLWKQCSDECLPLLAITCDIDHFKAYNDHYGHLAGDHCLHRVAAALEAALTGRDDVLARTGGEEFWILIPAIALATAGATAERLRLAVERLGIPHEATGRGFVSISAGFAMTVPKQSEEPEVLLSRADEALYFAKQEGRNRVRAWRASGETA